MKQNTLIEKLHTLLLTLCLTVITFCAHTLWEMNMKLAKNDEVDSRQDVAITHMAILISQGQGHNEENANRITYLEAILPDRVKIKNRTK
jgi:hypothetical protein